MESGDPNEPHTAAWSQRFEYSPIRPNPESITSYENRFLSQGCSVLSEEGAKCIYDIVPVDSTVVIFDKYNPLPYWYWWDNQASNPPYTPRKDVPNSVKLSQTTLTLNKGKSKKLTATLNPTNASHRGIKWSSSNSKVTTVDSTGKVTAKGKGTAVITVKVLGLTAKCTVTVK